MQEKMILDELNRRILRELQRDARQTVQQIAAAVGLSTTPCWKRIKDLESAGVITGYTALVDRSKLGLDLLVVVELNLSQHTEATVQQFERQVAVEPSIVNCMSTTGPSDYVLIVVARDVAHYEQLLHSCLFKLPGVSQLRSSIVLNQVKAETRLPLGVN